MSLGICDYTGMTTGSKVDWQATTGGGLHHHGSTHSLPTMRMSSLLNFSVGLGAVRLF